MRGENNVKKNCYICPTLYLYYRYTPSAHGSFEADYYLNTNKYNQDEE